MEQQKYSVSPSQDPTLRGDPAHTRTSHKAPIKAAHGNTNPPKKEGCLECRYEHISLHRSPSVWFVKMGYKGETFQ